MIYCLSLSRGVSLLIFRIALSEPTGSTNPRLVRLLQPVAGRRWVRAHGSYSDACTLDSAHPVRLVRMMKVGNAPQVSRGATELPTSWFWFNYIHNMLQILEQSIQLRYVPCFRERDGQSVGKRPGCQCSRLAEHHHSAALPDTPS